MDTLRVLSKSNEIIIISKKDIKLKKYKNIKSVNLNISRKLFFFEDIFVLLQIFKLLILNKPNLILTITPKISFIVSIILIFYPIKRIHFFTGQLWYNMKDFKKLIFKFIDRFIFIKSHICFADSKSQINYLIKEGFKKSKLKIINKGSMCGVDTNIFKKNEILKKSFREKYDIKKNDVILMFLGRINRDKGYYDLIYLRDLLYKNNIKISLVLIGHDEEDLILNENKNTRQKFIYLGYKKNPQHYFPCADIFVILSKREGFGLSVIQASSCQLPVIGYDVVGLKDSILNNKTGILINNLNNMKDIKKIFTIIKDKNLRYKLGKQGRKNVINNFEKKDVIHFMSKQIEKYI
tara:strand:+ start:454 stop:1506 length:1053 start_codon:yes stop_codon:yes gene_type:complete